jgi:superfamily I DNA/RNA helicase
MTATEGVPATDIVLLTPKARQRSQLWNMGPFGNFRLTDQWTGASGEVYCTTIHSFKGLESPVVILAEIENDLAHNLESLLYVGCSRARNHLVVIVSGDLPNDVADSPIVRVDRELRLEHRSK